MKTSQAVKNFIGYHKINSQKKYNPQLFLCNETIQRMFWSQGD
jgi:hypothetical protein